MESPAEGGLRLLELRFLEWEPISLELARGEVAAVLGSSGSGKSLLLRSVADLIPASGAVCWAGQASSSMAPTVWRRRVGLLPAGALWWLDRVGDHFLSPPSDGQLESVGLAAECLGWEPALLSMGERQRLAALRLLDREPECLLLDEPTANLDPESSSQLETLLLDYIAQRRASALWVTHDRGQAERVAQRCFEMKDKRLAEVGHG